MKIAFKAAVPVAAALLATGAVLGFLGCNRTQRTTERSSQTAEPAPALATKTLGYAYISNNGEGTVSEFSRRTDGELDFLRTVKAGAVNGPTGIAIDPSSRFVYVANEGDDRIYQFRIKRNTGELTAIGKGWVNGEPAGHPQQIAISSHGECLYVTNSGRHSDGKGDDGKGTDGWVAEYTIDSATGALSPLDVFRGGGMRQPIGIALTPSGQFAYVSDLGAGTLVAFAIGSDGRLKLVASTPSLGDKPGQPGLIAVHPSGTYVYTADRSIGSVVVARPAADGKLSVTKKYRVGISTSEPFGIALAAIGPNVFVYTANIVGDTVSSLAAQPDGLDLVGECPTGMGGPTGMVADPAGRNLYVVNRNASTVAQFAIGETNGVALTPKVSIFTDASPDETSHPLYIATTRWDAPVSTEQTPAQRTN